MTTDEQHAEKLTARAKEAAEKAHQAQMAVFARRQAEQHQADERELAHRRQRLEAFVDQREDLDAAMTRAQHNLATVVRSTPGLAALADYLFAVRVRAQRWERARDDLAVVYDGTDAPAHVQRAVGTMPPNTLRATDPLDGLARALESVTADLLADEQQHAHDALEQAVEGQPATATDPSPSAA